MTCRHVASLLEATQSAWCDAETAARATFATLRLDKLDQLHHGLTDADTFDAAYAIRDDYIEGRRANDRFDPLPTTLLREQARIFARSAVYLSAHDARELAETAWGTDTKRGLRLVEQYNTATPMPADQLKQAS